MEMDGYELGDHLSEQRLRPIGRYSENFCTSSSRVNVELHSQQAVYLSYKLKSAIVHWKILSSRTTIQ
jgi:hypothetical protein